MLDERPVLLRPVLKLRLRAQAMPHSPLGKAMTSKEWPFPNIRPGAHRHPRQVVEGLNTIGIRARPARNAALMHLAAAVLADLLGLHIQHRGHMDAPVTAVHASATPRSHRLLGQVSFVIDSDNCGITNG